ncbi:hypothetical protein SARC_12402 [Sphaeroforma arctica JP610]|uniref:RGS domain-containing protein n=1 Tax=Sphaeroforma arctica JP610 TaxID=667725 RepID=A0A0L0FE88_9EUKA|nr:hypothetical protein SARC_12402 [Sphaeroforma arctica JP610]KNC75067.1 hypothetical protein SARC_12402 [Sphaeroforma arctica JP610]|eukprot:XP_014148969.1 hypothetical protein SARC_12402 [Sphaeroforma arctica JP610]
MIIVVAVIPIILEQTVPWCFKNDLAYKGVQTLRVLFLIEIGFYVWKLGYAAQQFVHFQPIVRIFAAAVVLSTCKLVLPRVGVFDAVGEMWFEVASTYWDPRGELDFILADNELKAFLLGISKQRFCSENCNFLRDVDLLGDISDKGDGVLKLQTEHALLHKYIYKGVSTPVNLPGELIKSIPKIDINADSSSAEWISPHNIILEARAYIRRLLGDLGY